MPTTNLQTEVEEEDREEEDKGTDEESNTSSSAESTGFFSLTLRPSLVLISLNSPLSIYLPAYRAYLRQLTNVIPPLDSKGLQMSNSAVWFPSLLSFGPIGLSMRVLYFPPPHLGLNTPMGSPAAAGLSAIVSVSNRT